MAEAELGASFAIHGGGSDLVFPHHENEIAQSEAAGRPFAQIWMHNGMIETDAAKMSKSEGNIFQLSEALDRYGREAVVAYLISGHYRQPLAFGAEQMEQAVAQVERLRNFFREHPVGGGSPGRSRRRNSGEARSRPPRTPGSTRSAMRWPMTSTRRGRWPRHLSWWRKRIARRFRGRLRRCARCSSWSGSSRWPRRRRGLDREAEGLMAERRGGAGGQGLRAG